MNAKHVAVCVALLVGLSGCTTIEGETPIGGEKVYVASGYSLNECQVRLDQEAGEHVEVTEHVRQIGESILSLGLVPAYVCRGTMQSGKPANNP